MPEKIFLERASALDASDPLAGFRGKFVIDDPELIYLDGNSLGRLPSGAEKNLHHAIRKEWGADLIESWNKTWYGLPSLLGKKMAGILGSREDEVVICDSTSQNLFKLACGALELNSGRKKIISDINNFPSDLYLLQGIIKLLGDKHELVLVGRKDYPEADYNELFEAIDEHTALICLSHVAFKSSFLYDMKRVNDYAHSKGALVLWDLSHSAGVVGCDLNRSMADYAVGCSYKYLNGGPGSPAYLYVRKDLQEKTPSPVWGWFGQKNPFDFEISYRPAEGIHRYLTGTPPILSMIAMEEGIDIIREAGIERIRLKSTEQSCFLLEMIEKLLLPYDFSIGSPKNHENRGSHISIRHPEAFRTTQAMTDSSREGLRVIPDFRKPDNIRLGLSPLYNSYRDIYQSVILMEEIVKDKLYLKYSDKMDGVT